MFSLIQLCSVAFDRISQSVRSRNLTAESVLQEFALSNAALRRLMNELNRQMDVGLRCTNDSSVAMLPSFVPALTDGSERGKYLAMDLGGTNLRVFFMEVDGSENASSSQNFKVPHHIMTGTGQQLFDYLVTCMASFVRDKDLQDVELPLGFTFSYPCDQASLHSAILLRWTKGFTSSGVVGKDVVHVFRDAIKRNGGIKIGQISLINDTVGAMIATGEEHSTCVLGVIIGTGTNAAYLEDTSRILKLSVPYPYEQVSFNVWNLFLPFVIVFSMIIDTEWGAFGDHGELDYVKTEFDRVLDSRTVYPGEYTFDKLVAGMYMGEVVRLVLECFVKNKFIFAGRGSEILFTVGSFPTKFISEVLGDEGGYLYNARQVMDELGIDGYSYSDLLLLREICMVVSRRSANLAAAAVACVVNRIGKRKATVGIDGSTYRYHPFFHSWMTEKARQLLEENIELTIVQAGDGSGKGAALVAAIAQNLEERNQKKQRIQS